MRLSTDTTNNESSTFCRLMFLGSLPCVLLADLSKLSCYLLSSFSSIPWSFECSSLSGPQNHSFREHERVQNALMVVGTVSCIPCPMTCGVCEKAPQSSGISGKYWKPHSAFPCGPWRSCLQCNCSSGPGLSVQEAVALLMIILRSPLVEQRWAKVKQ